VPLLQSIGMHCLGCVMASSETIDQACQAHGVNSDEIVSKLTALIKQ
jgi:hybrid cluster-associated redox disulfide protein